MIMMTCVLNLCSFLYLLLFPEYFSAGVGRSGTFIALDRILQQIQKYEYVDIFAIVYEMRKERVWMVQNEVSLHYVSPFGVPSIHFVLRRRICMTHLSLSSFSNSS